MLFLWMNACLVNITMTLVKSRKNSWNKRLRLTYINQLKNSIEHQSNNVETLFSQGFSQYLYAKFI